MTSVVLAVDTSSEVASVAVLRDGTVVAEEESPSPMRNDQLLLPRIHETLEAAHVALNEVTLLAVDSGPGSFGGLRVGLATVKGLAIADGTPTVGVCSLLAIANSAPVDARWVLALIDAHRGELYAALYERDGARLVERMAPVCGRPEQIAAAACRVCDSSVPYVLGDGLRDHATALAAAWPALSIHPTASDVLPRARHVGLLALSLLASRGPDILASLLPNYIRESDAKLPTQPLELSGDQQ